jgi:putative ubiquitin-RnfH superfamily antitoxin RatB of RatAB toxin-antitoxin module
MKRCTVVCDSAAGMRSCELILPDEATVDVALLAARTVLGEQGTDWEQAATGVYGRICARSHCWEDGDRIEIYRPLQIDPRVSRRQRARQKR